MPSDEMVEKVAVIIRKRVRQRIEQDWDGMVYALDGVEDAAREIAALTAAMGEEKPVAWRSRWTYPDVSSAWIITPHRPQDTTPRGHLATYVCEPLFAHPPREDVVGAALEIVKKSLAVEEEPYDRGWNAACRTIAAAIRKLGERS
jgi:hypothetical protein